ncbi:MAG: hypothetical protein PHT02_00655 [Tissierellia bacterium]|nr:hypothetical protein [Tissierellia bacterium]
MEDNYWKEKYDDLLYYYRKRGDKISNLEKEVNKLYDRANHAEFRITTELEPRIQREYDSYDSYVTSGGSDECFHNGDSGRCGVECSVFGSKIECFESMTSKDILNLYKDGYDFDYILDYIEDMGLSEEKKKIDIEYYEGQIEIKRLELEKLQNELNKTKENKNE